MYDQIMDWYLDHRTFRLIWGATWETLYMVGIAGFIGFAVGIPMGVILHVTKKGGLLANSFINLVLGAIVNIGRSVPFLVLMVAIIPFTTFLIGKFIGTTAAIVPLTVGGIPFIARLVESALVEVPSGLIEAAQSMGARPLQIIMKVLLPEALPSIVNTITITLVTLVGYSAMAGTVGGGGLGDVAMRYGYQRYQPDIMFITVVLLVVIVQVIQMVGDKIARRVDHR